MSFSGSSAKGDTVTPWERANFTGFSNQPFTVLTIASISRAVMTAKSREIERTNVLHTWNTMAGNMHLFWFCWFVCFSLVLLVNGITLRVLCIVFNKKKMLLFFRSS